MGICVPVSSVSRLTVEGLCGLTPVACVGLKLVALRYLHHTSLNTAPYCSIRATPLLDLGL